MKRILLILIGLLLSVPVIFGQEGQLILTHKSKDKERAIDAGTKLKAYKSEYFYLKGELGMVDSASITVGKDTVLLEDILRIEAQTSGKRAIGAAIAVIGVVAVGGGIVALAEANAGEAWSSAAVGVGLICTGALMTTLGVSRAVIGKAYKQRSWTYHVRLNSLPAN